MFILISILFITLIFIWAYLKYEANQKLTEGFKGRKEVLILGNVLDFIRDIDQMIPYMTKLVEDCGERAKFSIGTNVIAVIASAEDAEKILGSSAHIQKGDEYRFSHEWLGLGLLTTTGDKWRLRRKLLTPAFHNQILDDFIPVVNEQADTLVSILKSTTDHQPCEIQKELTLAALDVICETAMGRTVNAQLKSESPYIRAVNEVTILVMSRLFKPWLMPEILWKASPTGKQATKDIKILHGFTKEVLKERQLQRTLQKNYKMSTQNDEKSPSDNEILGTKKKQAFLDLLLQIQEDQPGSLTSQEILNEIDTFCFAGHDTVATALKWTILRLGNHPEVQEKVQKELDGIFGDDRSRVVTKDDLRRMEYLELVIKESMRLHPVVPSIIRKITTPLEFDNGALIKPGVAAWIFIHHLHRNPKYWKSPDEFIPERFTLENSRGRHPYAYVPFSAGPRNCIGQKFATIVHKVILAKILCTFSIKSVQKIEDIQQAWEVILIPKDGVHLELTLRPPISSGISS